MTKLRFKYERFLCYPYVNDRRRPKIFIDYFLWGLSTEYVQKFQN